MMFKCLRAVSVVSLRTRKCKALLPSFGGVAPESVAPSQDVVGLQLLQ